MKLLRSPAVSVPSATWDTPKKRTDSSAAFPARCVDWSNHACVTPTRIASARAWSMALTYDGSRLVSAPSCRSVRRPPKDRWAMALAVAEASCTAFCWRRMWRPFHDAYANTGGNAASDIMASDGLV